MLPHFWVSSWILLLASCVIAYPHNTTVSELKRRSVLQGTGKASFYGSGLAGDAPSPSVSTPPACGVDYLPPDGVSFASLKEYDKSHCGKCLNLTCTDAICKGKSTVAFVSDYCPTCTAGGVDISLKLFADLVGTREKAIQMGIVHIAWQETECPSSWTA